LLQISLATFLPNISYSENKKGELFLKHSVYGMYISIGIESMYLLAEQ